MPYKQIGFDAEVANRIRGIYGTVNRHRRTSIALRGSVGMPTKVLATQRADEVANIAEKWADSPVVQRWVDKYMAFMDQHDLWTDAID